MGEWPDCLGDPEELAIEFEELKREVEELRKLIAYVVEYVDMPDWLYWEIQRKLKR